MDFVPDSKIKIVLKELGRFAVNLFLILILLMLFFAGMERAQTIAGAVLVGVLTFIGFYLMRKKIGSK